MINRDRLVKDYNLLLAKCREKDEEIERLKDNKTHRNDLNKALDKISELQSMVTKLKIRVNSLKKESNNLLNANIKLADAIKEYNPNHFGGGEGRHDSETIKDTYYDF